MKFASHLVLAMLAVALIFTIFETVQIKTECEAAIAEASKTPQTQGNAIEAAVNGTACTQVTTTAKMIGAFR